MVSTMASMVRENNAPSARTGVMSLNTIPGLGKSETSRRAARRRSMEAVVMGRSDRDFGRAAGAEVQGSTCGECPSSQQPSFHGGDFLRAEVGPQGRGDFDAAVLTLIGLEQGNVEPGE